VFGSSVLKNKDFVVLNLKYIFLKVCNYFRLRLMATGESNFILYVKILDSNVSALSTTIFKSFIMILFTSQFSCT